MSKQKKSAKDLAFEKERAEYRHRINELERRLNQEKGWNKKYQEEIEQLYAKQSELQDWIDRLLEYTEMSEEDMKKLIQKDKDSAEIAERVNGLFKIRGLFGSGIW